MNNILAEYIHAATDTVRRRARFAALRKQNHSEAGAASFDCPICLYSGPLLRERAPTAQRRYARCPHCGALERHRLQWLVIQELAKQLRFQNLSILHVAPEGWFRSRFRREFGAYTSTDLSGRRVDYKADLCSLPFSDESFDVIYASHVLEHIKDDSRALSEIARVLRPNGAAILPVPILTQKTIEYPEPNPREHYHVRCPGEDYYTRYRSFFSEVVTYASSQFPARYQTYIYEDRSTWPNQDFPLRRGSEGEKHEDIVPVCFS